MTNGQRPMTNQCSMSMGRGGRVSASPGACPSGARTPTSAARGTDVGVRSPSAPPLVGHCVIGHWSFFRFAHLARAAQCPACTVPVFRYGLDNWQADAFRLEVPASALTDPKLADFFRNLGTAQPRISK